MADSKTTWASVHTAMLPQLDDLLAQSDALGLDVRYASTGEVYIDAGVSARGGLEAGRRIAEICMGGLGSVHLGYDNGLKHWPWRVFVSSTQPVVSCLASQYAGWSLSCPVPDKEKSFNALGSGPARALGSGEDLLKEMAYKDQANRSALVLESDRMPPDELAAIVAKKCGLSTRNISIIVTPTGSISGMVQIVARVLETSLHKAHALGFPLADIVDGMGSAPLCPPGGGSMTAMGRTNDAILFAGQVHLYVNGDDDSAADLAQRLPSRTSDDYGRPFAEIFKAVNYDFYQIDPMLFSPAQATVTALSSGRTWCAGGVDAERLHTSFGAIV